MSQAKLAQKKIPAWSDNEIVKVRQAARKGLTAAEAGVIIRSPLGETAIRDRAKRLGITFVKKNSAHEGTSKLSLPPSS
jgi:hypothetical protein